MRADGARERSMGQYIEEDIHVMDLQRERNYDEVTGR
jgi:hypothetical protein